ncbi:MAG: transporter [Solirubrobacterales bacterium]|nr:transporter [Solirubrobacterales bacterium]
MPKLVLPLPPEVRTAALVPVLVGVTLVVSIVSSLGAPLVPSVAVLLDVSLADAQWSLTAALLAGAVAAPVLGRLGDGPRRRGAMVGGLLVVLVGSIVAGLAPSLELLVVGRVMQGVGLGLAPIAMAAAREHLPPDRSPGVIGLLSVTAAAGVGAGYPVSGVMADVLGLRAAFLFGGVASAVALVAVAVVVPPSRAPQAIRLDVSGAAVGAVGLVAGLLAVSQGASWGWGSPGVVGLVLASAAVLALWSRLQLTRAAPLVDLRQLRHRAVWSANVAAVLLGVALYMFLSLVTQFVQVAPDAGFGFGASAFVAGSCLVPFAITSLGASRLAPTLMRQLGVRPVLVGGALMIAGAGGFFAIVHEALWEAFLTMGVIGLGFGLTFAVLPGLIAGSVPDEELGSAMGFFHVVRSVGYAVGSALAASILAGHEVMRGAGPSEQGYVLATSVAAAVCLAAAAAAGFLSPRPGATLTCRPTRRYGRFNKQTPG